MRWRDRVIFNGSACFGSTNHYLAVALAALGKYPAADALFRDAAAQHAVMAAPALLALSKLEWARMLLLRHGLSDAVRARAVPARGSTHDVARAWS